MIRVMADNFILASNPVQLSRKSRTFFRYSRRSRNEVRSAGDGSTGSFRAPFRRSSFDFGKMIAFAGQILAQAGQSVLQWSGLTTRTEDPLTAKTPKRQKSTHFPHWTQRSGSIAGNHGTHEEGAAVNQAHRERLWRGGHHLNELADDRVIGDDVQREVVAL